MAECELVVPPRECGLNIQPDVVVPLCSKRFGFHVRPLHLYSR
jgi:hypothetical protein